MIDFLGPGSGQFYPIEKDEGEKMSLSPTTSITHMGHKNLDKNYEGRKAASITAVMECDGSTVLAPRRKAKVKGTKSEISFNLSEVSVVHIFHKYAGVNHMLHYDT